MYDSWLEQIQLEATRQSKINELYGGEEQRKRI
jgi:ABC-type Mn2+/Zn2+ transport system ATPase subunit